MTISKKERNRLRGEICLNNAGINILLDALEAAEAAIAVLSENNAFLDDSLKYADAAYHDSKARAEAAERERDALIKTIACEKGCDCCPVDGSCEGIDCEKSPELGESFCTQKILAWARQQARGGGNKL